jgi:hypothetical protein
MKRWDLLLRTGLCVAASAAWMGCSSSDSSPGGGAGSATPAGGSGGAGGTGQAGSGAGTSGSGGSVGGVGGSAVSLPGNSLNGTLMGMSFTVAATSYWIGMPGGGSAPTQIYLVDEKLSCQAISAPGWDKTIATSTQVLEMGVFGSMPGTYHINTDADANYLGGNYNPSADGGTITITTVNPGQNIVGSFDLTFVADTLKGMFDASWCASGVEP